MQIAQSGISPDILPMQIKNPYFMFLGDVPDQLAAKTAQGIVDWRRDWCLGQLRLHGCKADLGIPDMTIAEAVQAGAQTMIIGVVNAGGTLPDHWTALITEALDAGLDVASGLHIRLGSRPEIRAAAERNGRSLFDVRQSDRTFATGKGVKRTGKRLLTVGTDCSVGKKYTVLALEAGMRTAGFDADFKATPRPEMKTPVCPVAIDAVVADFISGAAEWISPDADPGHWDLVEGQGSLFHPSFAGVSLGLLHGSQPDAFIVCHEPTRKTMRGVQMPLPTIQQVIDLTIECGRLTNPAIRCTGIAVNTQVLDETAARALLDEISKAHGGLPATDPVRFGVDNLVARIAEEFGGPAPAGR